ncbi:uncharacterized protein LOC123873147 [Maniola jurtina]|uniref:uncharacterized protein LOC123873147 n=1 Tax=Maniola jurtina TaxID=191418 RepID=UPI001E68E93F|nr:uncharacterized protein LOC123873147 [Maniola jurtina]
MLELARTFDFSRLLEPLIIAFKYIVKQIWAPGLEWKSPSSRWKTYVANCIDRIQETIPPSHWHLIRTEDNPADCASRGLSVQQCIDHHLCWSDPKWLSSFEPVWSNARIIEEPATAKAEQRDSVVSSFVAVDQLNNYPSLPKSLRKLHPFLDENGLVRVGGRLVHSELDHGCKSSLSLPRQPRLTSRLVNQMHADNMHPSLRTLSYLLAQNHWILSSRRAISSQLSKCVKYYRDDPKFLTFRMSGLPKLKVFQLKARSWYPWWDPGGYQSRFRGTVSLVHLALSWISYLSSRRIAFLVSLSLPGLGRVDYKDHRVRYYLSIFKIHVFWWAECSIPID